eukprot:2047155-Pleurochrysis_carterae.AAC.2
MLASQVQSRVSEVTNSDSFKVTGVELGKSLEETFRVSAPLSIDFRAAVCVVLSFPSLQAEAASARASLEAELPKLIEAAQQEARDAAAAQVRAGGARGRCVRHSGRFWRVWVGVEWRGVERGLD